jgi:hypothetical protein
MEVSIRELQESELSAADRNNYNYRLLITKYQAINVQK